MKKSLFIIFIGWHASLLGALPLCAQESCYAQYLREHNMRVLTAEDADDSYDELKKTVLAWQLYGSEASLPLRPIEEPAAPKQQDTAYVIVHLALVDSTWYMWMSVDPFADKNPSLTPYIYCSGNPIVRIDPDGRADYYDIDGNHLCNDGIDDRKVFQQSDNGDIQFGAYSFLFSYIGEVDKISLLYEGSMVDGKNQSAGNLIVSQHVGDKVFNQIFAAVSGNKNAYTLQNGEYSCSLFRYRSPSEGQGGYYNNGYGFSINLNPLFTTMRTELRIHPDGGKQGTLGCIGLSGESNELLQFVRMVTPFIPTDSKNSSVLLNVVIADNPGCFKAAGKTTPALFR